MSDQNDDARNTIYLSMRQQKLEIVIENIVFSIEIINFLPYLKIQAFSLKTMIFDEIC